MDKDELYRVFRNVVNAIAPAHVYLGWADDTARGQVHETMGKLEEYLKDLNIDWPSLGAADLRMLGFKAWEEPDAEGNVVMLAPLYLMPVFPSGLRVTAIDGDVLEIGKDELDHDIRFGCVPWGFKVKETPIDR